MKSTFVVVVFFLGLAPVEGAWQFCRLKHKGSGAADYPAWAADYPDAEMRLIDMLKDVMLLDAKPRPLVVSVTGKELSQCPFVFASNIDKLVWTEDEAAIIGDWMRKGGLLWTDGFWGNGEAWENWGRQLRKALPEAEIQELQTHPIFEYPFQVKLRQSCFYGSGFVKDGWVKNFAVQDDKGRLMVLMTFNELRVNQCGVVGDAWEGFSRNWQNEQAAWRFSINVILHIMTH